MDTPELWLLITCLGLIATWIVAEALACAGRRRDRFGHARRCAAAREQMRRELGGAR